MLQLMEEGQDFPSYPLRLRVQVGIPEAEALLGLMETFLGPWGLQEAFSQYELWRLFSCPPGHCPHLFTEISMKDLEIGFTFPSPP